MPPTTLERLAELTPRQRYEFLRGLRPAQREALAAVIEREHVDTVDPLAGATWEEWNQAVAPRVFNRPYGDHHRAFWEWTETILPDRRPDPFLALWPRGSTKSTCAELLAVKLGARRLRRYCLYLGSTQDTADDHVGNIGAVLESPEIARHYPALSERRIGKFGSSKGWRRNRLRTASGFTVDALGLDTAARGARLEEQRPDVLILDDVDHEHDTPRTVDRKLRTITQALLPAITPNAVVMMAQNLTHPNAIAAKLASGETDILMGAVRSGPFPAVYDMELKLEDGRWRIVGGRPSWEGMDLEACEDQIGLMGLTAFTIECQQDIEERPGALWTRDLIAEHRVEAAPELDRIVVAVDPNQTGQNDDAGIVVVGRACVGGVAHAFVLADHTQTTSPEVWRDTAAEAYLASHAGAFVVERTGLGDHARLTLEGAPLLRDRPVTVEPVDANLGKADRARPIAALYRDGRVHHVGAFPVLESQQTTWEPDVSSISPGAVDALVHGVTHLLIDSSGPPKIRWLPR